MSNTLCKMNGMCFLVVIHLHKIIDLPHQFKADTEVIPEIEVIQHVYNIMRSVLAEKKEKTQLISIFHSTK